MTMSTFGSVRAIEAARTMRLGNNGKLAVGPDMHSEIRNVKKSSMPHWTPGINLQQSVPILHFLAHGNASLYSDSLQVPQALFWIGGRAACQCCDGDLAGMCIQSTESKMETNKGLWVPTVYKSKAEESTFFILKKWGDLFLQCELTGVWTSWHRDTRKTAGYAYPWKKFTRSTYCCGPFFMWM